jgi:hypothetical protein
MAGHSAIAAVSLTLRDILREAYPSSGLGASLDARLYQTKDFTDPMKEGVGLFLWRMAPNANCRNTGMRTDALGRRFKPSLPVDLHYMLIPFAEDSERQQRLFGWMLRTVEDAGSLLASRLNNALALPDVFHAGEAVEVVLESLTVSDHLTLWDRIKTMPLYANYVVRMVMLDAATPITEARTVVERALEVGVLR